MISLCRSWSRLYLIISVSLLAVSCSGGELRGKSVPSPDGTTYLVVDDDNGGACSPILVDGREWPVGVHEQYAIAPGVHEISCGVGGGIEFEIQAATTFHFDYWGP